MPKLKVSRRDAAKFGLTIKKNLNDNLGEPEDLDDMPFRNFLSCVWVPGWRPTELNQLMGRRESFSGALKRKDREVVSKSFMFSGLLRATGRRRIDLHIVLERGQRRLDKDGQWKSVLDALTHCGAILGDSPTLVMQGAVSFSRAEELVGEKQVYGTFIIIEDLE